MTASEEGDYMFNASTLSLFRERLCLVLTRDLGLAAGFSLDFAHTAEELLRRKGVGAFVDIRARLRRSHIDARWEALLDEQRSRVMADWVAPYVRGSVLDLLATGGRTGQLLAEIGSPVTISARPESYKFDRSLYTLPYLYFSEESAHVIPACDTVMLNTALHRESDQEGILALAASASRGRLLIVEHVVEPDYPPELLLLWDMFYNQCLTTRGLLSSGQYRTAEEWMAPALCPGRIAAVERRDDIPGVPLAHALIVIDVRDESIHPGDRAVYDLYAPRPRAVA